MSLNKAMIIGYLGGSPELKMLPSGIPVANFSVATNSSYTASNGVEHKQTEWHRVVVFSKLAEICVNYLKKGSQVYIEGRLQTREWEPKDGGAKQYRTEIVALRVQFLDKRPVEIDADVANGAVVGEVPF